MQIVPTMKASLVTVDTFATDDIKIITVVSDNNAFSVLHRPPGSCFSKSIGSIKAPFDFVSTYDYCLYMGGDVNINMLLPGKPEMRVIFDCSKWFL